MKNDGRFNIEDFIEVDVDAPGLFSPVQQRFIMSKWGGAALGEIVRIDKRTRTYLVDFGYGFPGWRGHTSMWVRLCAHIRKARTGTQCDL